MSIRSQLRAEALERDDHRCQWPGCNQTGAGNLDMAHIVPVGSGGKDVIENVLMLCKAWHHDMHDGRSQRSLHEYRLLLLDWLYLRHGYYKRRVTDPNEITEWDI